VEGLMQQRGRDNALPGCDLLEFPGMNRICLRLVFVFGLLVSCPFLVGQTSQAQVPAEYTFTLIRAFHHDTSAYTQGLAYQDGFLYEGTGLNGHSSLRKTNLETGIVLQRIDLQPEFFGEGITIVRGKIVQLTWKSQTGFVYDLKNFHLLQQFSYPGEGWGLATNSRELFMTAHPRFVFWTPKPFVKSGVLRFMMARSPSIN
jgi:glutamine cyclotransferase